VEAQKKLKHAEMLLSVSRKCAAMESLDEILETLVNMTTTELGAERGSLFLNDGTTGELYSRVAQGNFPGKSAFSIRLVLPVQCSRAERER